MDQAIRWLLIIYQVDRIFVDLGMFRQLCYKVRGEDISIVRIFKNEGDSFDIQ